jgi:Holliday junction resolvase RusA-like endonuclease|tara:strand:- start:229 stop:609 length:381 start_codon:yes stop_codon:yes gene_type:complete
MHSEGWSEAMKGYTITVSRKPKVKARPRHNKRGQVFTPKSTLEEEDHVAAAWSEQVGEILSGPLEVYVAYSPSETILHVLPSPHGSRTLRGDLDNYVKLTLDALNGVAWGDDGQVVRITAVKVDEA